MTARVARRSVRARLALTTAIAGALMMLPGMAAGQTMPGSLPGTGDAAVVAGSATVAGTGTALTVSGIANNTVINWRHFDVPTATAATFTTTSTSPVAVLNRVVGINDGMGNIVKSASDLSGTLTGTNVEVWISNTAGIMVGGGAHINTNGLVLTTLDIDQTAFGTGTNTHLFANSSGNITTSGTGTYTLNSSNGVLAVIAPAVQLTNTSGNINAGTGGAAFVAATDVTMRNPGSPLGITINQGTTFATGAGNALDVAGTVGGGRVLMVVSAQQMYDTLLKVSANVTASGAGNNVVILAGNETANPDYTGSVAFGTGAGLAGGGSLQLTGIINAGTGGVVLGARSTPTATPGPGMITASGAITAANVSSQSYGAQTLTAAGNVIANANRLTSTNGSLTLSDGASLTVNANGASAATNLTISTVGATSGLTLAAPISATTGVVSLTGSGGISLGTTVTGGSAVMFNNAVTLTADSAVNATTATTGTATFASTIGSQTNGTYGLTVSADGTKTFSGSVGAATNMALKTLASKDYATTTANGSTVFAAAATAVTTTGDQSYAGSVSINAPTTTFTGASTANGTFGAITGGGTTTNTALALSFAGITKLNAVNGVTTLQSSATGTTNLNDDVTTTGTQTYSNAVTLGNGVTLDAGAGDIGFASTIDGARMLTVKSDGVKSFAGAVGSGMGTALTSLTTQGSTAAASGSTTFGSSTGAITVTTSGAQSYSGTALLAGATTVLTSTGGSAVMFAGAVNGSSQGGQALTVSSAGQKTFSDAVGGAAGSNQALASLLSNGGGATAINGGSIMTTGDQEFTGAVTLGADTTLTSTSAGAIKFDSTIDSATTRALTVSTTGTTTFGGSVGATDALASLSTSTGPVTIGASTPVFVTTTGAAGQSYGGAVTLGADAPLNAGVGGITFAGSIAGNHALVVKADGTKSFGGSVGAGGSANVLTSLTVQGSTAPTTGMTGFSTGTVTTSGLQSYTGTVALNAASTIFLSTGSGAVSFLGAVNGTSAGANALTVTTDGQKTFGGAVGGPTAAQSAQTLASLLSNGAGPTLISGGSVYTAGSQEYVGAVTLGNATTLKSDSSTTAIKLDGTVDSDAASTPRALTLSTPFGTTFGRAVGVTAALASLSSMGTTTFNSASSATPTSVTTTGDQNYGAVTLGADAIFTGANAVYNGTLAGGGHALTLSFTGAAAGGVGGTVLYTVSGVTTLSTGNGGTTTLNGNVTTTGTQTYNDAVILGQAVILDSGTSATNNVLFNNTLDGSFGLTVNSAGTTSFQAVGGITALDLLTTNAAGTTVLNGNVRTQTGQTYNDAVTTTVANGTTQTLTNNAIGNITFNNTLNGTNNNAGQRQQLLIDAGGAGGATIVNAAVGGTTPFANLTIGHSATVNANISAERIAFSGPGSAVTVTGARTITATNTAADALSFSNAVGGSTGALTLAGNATATGGLGTGTLGALGSLMTTGTLALTGNVATTTAGGGTGTQVYGGIVTITGDSTLSGVTATFPAGYSVRPATSGGRNLTLNFTGVEALDGGTFTDGTNQFAGLTVGPAGGTAGASTTLTGGFLTSNAVTFNNVATLGSNTTVMSGAGGVAFNNTLDGAAGTETLAVTTTATGTSTFAGLVGNTTRLGSLTTTGGLVAINTTSIKTGAGGQRYGGAATLGATAMMPPATVVLDASGNGNITFTSTLDGSATGAQALTINTGGTTTLSGVGGTQALASLTTDAQGTGGTVLNGNVKTTGAQAYSDAVTLGNNVQLIGTTGTGATFTAASLTGAGHDLLIDFAGGKTVSGATFTGIANFADYGTGATMLSGAFTTSGYQFFGDNNTVGGSPTTLTGATTLTSTGNQTIRFGTSSTLDGNYALSVVTQGDSRFLGAIGNTTALTSLTTDAGGTTTIGGPSASIIAATQTYNDAVTLIDDARTLSAATKIEFNAGLGYTNNAPAAGILTLSGDGTKLFAAAGGVVTLNSLTTNSTTAGAGVLTVSGGGVTTAAAQTYNAKLTLGANTILTGGGAFSAPGGVAGAGKNLTLNFTGTKAVDGSNFTSIANLTTIGTGATTLSNTITTTGAQSYNGPVLLGTTTTAVAAGANAISFLGTVDASTPGNQSLAVTMTGLTTFGGLVGNTTRLGSLSTSAGPVAVNTSSIKTATSQSYGGAVTLGATTGSPAATVVTFDSSGSATTGSITFGGTVNAATADAQALTVSTLGTTSFTGPVGALGRLDAVTVGAGPTTFNATATTLPTSVTTKNDQTYGSVTLGTGTGATFTGANGTFGAISGAGKALTLSFIGMTSLGAVGDTANRLASLTSDNGGTTTLNGDVATTGSQTYGDNVVLGASLTTAAGTGAISFNGTLDATTTGAQGLTVTTGGTTTFAGLVGNTAALASLSTSTGPIAINTTSIKTTGSQGYGGAVTLGVDTVLTGSDAGATFMATSLNGAGHDLTLDFGGAKTVNGFTGVRTLKTQGNGATMLSGTIATSGAQTYINNVSLTGTTALSSSGTGAAGNVSFGGTVDGAQALSVTTAGVTSFAGTVGGMTGLTSLSTDAAGSTTIGADVTAATQSYGDPVNLTGSPRTLTASTSLAFGGTLNGTTTALALTGAGAKSFAGAVNLGSLATTGGALTVSGGSVTTTTGGQSYGGSGLVLSNNAVLTGSGGVGGAAFSATSVTGNGRNLTLDFTGAKGVNGATFTGIGGLTTQGAGTTTLSGALTTSGAQSYNDAVLLGSAATSVAAGGNAIAFNGTLDATAAGTQALTVTTSGTTTFAGLVGNTAELASLSTSTGPVVINTSSIKTSGAQSYGGNTALGIGTALASSGGGAIGFTGTVDGGYALAVNTGGTTTFGGAVGNTAALASVATDAGGTTAINGGSVRTTGAQSYGDAVMLGAGTVLSSTGSGAIGFATTIDGAQVLAINTAGATTFGGAVGATAALASLATDTGGTTAINGGSVRTTGLQSYGDPVTLGLSTTLTSTMNGAIGFVGTVDALSAGAQSLTVNTGGVTSFGGAVGGSAVLASLATDAPGSTAIGGGLVSTTGTQSYNDAVTLGAGTTLTSSGMGAAGNIAFATTLDGAQALAVNTAGATSFGGAVGATTALASLTTDGAGTTAINGGSVRTIGLQSYGDPVTLGTSATLSSTANGAIGFAGTLDALNAGVQSAAINTGGVTSFGGAVGGSSALANLSTDAPGSTAINGGVATTTGGQTYGDAVTLGAATVLTSGTGGVGFATTLDGAQSLSVNTAGTTSFGGAVGSATALTSLATDAGGTTAINGGLVRTSGGQSYGDAVTLGAGATLSSTGAGAIGFATTIDGAQALAVNTTGATGFGGAVGATTALASLTTDAGGTTAINGGSVRTTGNQTYYDTVTLGADTRLSSTANGTLGFAGTVDGAYLLSLTTGGAVQASGVIGGTTAINGLAVRAGSFAGQNGNRVGTIAANVAGGLAYDDAAALTIGTVDGLSGIDSGTSATTVSAGGTLALAANVAAGTTSLTGTGVTQAAGTGVNAGAGTILIDANDGAIAMAGTLTTTNAAANAVRITDSAGAVLGSITTGSGGTVTLGLAGGDNLSGNVGQTAGTTITTGTLLGSIGGAANLTNAGNSIATLGAFGANGVAMRDSRSGLAVVGPVNAGAGNLALTLDAGTLALQGTLIATTGTVSLTSGGAISQTGGVITADTLTGSSTGGASLTSAGNTITRLAGFANGGGGGLALTDGRALAVTGDTTTAGDLTINAVGIDFTGRTLSGTGALTLVGNAGTVTGATAIGGTNASVTAASVNLGTVRANNGALALSATGAGGAGLTVGTASAGGAATLSSQAGLAVTGSLNAGTSASLTATGAATLGQTTAGSSLTVTANLITAGATRAATTLSFTSGGNINLASAQAGGDALFDAGGTASLGAVTAGSASGITVRALDAQITGAQTAGKVAFVNRAPATVAFKLGNGTSAGGFQLSQDEINLVNAGALTFDGGSGNAELGALAFSSAAGSTSVSVLATGRIDVLGAVSGSGSGRSFLLGGTATTTSDKASVIEVVAKPTGGASLLFDTANLELRGARIGVGQQAGFLTPIGFDGANGQPVSTVSTAYVGNANSALYNSTYGGAAYPTAVTLVSANSLTVRYTDYALFQNTGAPGVNAGVMLGGSSSAPVRNALVLDAAGSNNAFALYGTINGINGSGTALLGSQVISFSGSNLANTRVNGCLVGSGGGCLTSVVSQPVLNVFDSSRLNVFQSADDLAVPFDPVVGNNNEALFSGVAVLDGPVIDARCEGSDDPACKAPDTKPAPPANEKKGK